MGESPRQLNDRTALLVMAFLVSLLGNVLLLQQLFVGRQEYLAQLNAIDSRLTNIERRIGIYAPASPGPSGAP